MVINWPVTSRPSYTRRVRWSRAPVLHDLIGCSETRTVGAQRVLDTLRLLTFIIIIITVTKAVTRGVFWVFEHPRNFREKLDTQKQIYY